MDIPVIDATSMIDAYTSSRGFQNTWIDSNTKNESSKNISSNFSGKKVIRTASKKSQITPRKLFSNSATPLTKNRIRSVTSKKNRKESKPVILDSSSTFEAFKTLASKERLGGASRLVFTDSKNQAVKEHFVQQMRDQFGDRIVNYLLLPAINKAYLDNEIPLTLGTVRATIEKAETIKAHVENYIFNNSNDNGLKLDPKIAEIIGYATFFEKEALQSLTALKTSGIPSKHLAEGYQHAFHYLGALGLSSAVLITGTATMTSALVLAVHLSPNAGAALGLIPWAMSYGISNTERRLQPGDSGTTRMISNALNVSVIAPSATSLAALLTNASAHPLLFIPTGLLTLTSAFFLDFTQPARTLSTTLPDPHTPLEKACDSAVKLSESTTLLNHTIQLQKHVVDTYKEAVELTSKEQTMTLVPKELLEKSTQQLANLKQLQPESPYRYRSGRFRPALI